MITRVSRAAASRTSYSIADGPPTSTPGPPARLTAARRSRDQVERGRRVGLGLEHGAEQRALRARCAGRAGPSATPSTSRERAADRADVAAARHDHVGRRGRARRERLREQLLALDRLDLVAEGVGLRQARVDRQQPERADHEHARGADPDPPRARAPRARRRAARRRASRRRPRRRSAGCRCPSRTSAGARTPAGRRSPAARAAA